MYVAVARKHLRLMALLMCLSLTGGLVYYIYAKPIYYSKALVNIDYLALPVDTDKLYKDGRIRAVIRQLIAPHVRERTARALGVKASEREITRSYVLKIATRLNSEQNLELEIWPSTREWAAKWSETMVREFLLDRQEKRIAENEEAIKGFETEYENINAKLHDKLDKKFDFKTEQDVTQSAILLNSMRELPLTLARIAKRIDEMGRVRVRLTDSDLDVIARLSLISSVEKKTESQLGIGQMVSTPASAEAPKDGAEPPAPANSVVVVPPMVKSVEPWEAVAKEQQQIKSLIEEAARTYLPGHRKMMELAKQLDTVNRQLDTEYQVAQNRFDLEYQELINKRKDLDAKLPEYQEVLKKHESLTQQANSMTRGDLPYLRYLDELSKKINAIKFGGEKERVDLNYLGLLELRDDPVSPNRLKLALFALLLGTILSLGVPFLIEYLDHTLTNLEQVESTFQLRGLGIVPKLESTETLALISTDDSKVNSLIENFRVIRTNVLSMGSLSKTPHVIMVTSAMPKEGKTVVSSNLAISFAHTGVRTLLIDTDLRRGRLHRLFGYRKSPGLSNVLLDEIGLDEACRPTNHENLTVLSAGRHLQTGTELLASQKFIDLMATLRGRYERIIVDTPPVLGLSETSIMQGLVDGVLFVIWSAHTPIRNMKAAIEMLQANGANFYGFVLNRLDLSATQNYYQYYYYSHDYYYHRHALENA